MYIYVRQLFESRELLRGLKTFLSTVSHVRSIKGNISLPVGVYVHDIARWPIDLLSASLKDCAVVYDFVSETEELQLYEEVHPRLKVQRYEEEHWDNAIRQYREIEKRFWKEENQLVIDRLKATQFPVGAYHQPFVHVLDIARDGAVLPHIDSVRLPKHRFADAMTITSGSAQVFSWKRNRKQRCGRTLISVSLPSTKSTLFLKDRIDSIYMYCGSTISGISLLSDAVMRLVHAKDKQLMIDLYLKRRSVYTITGVARYDFTHETLGEEKSVFNGIPVHRDRRISIICRNMPENASPT